MSLAAVGHFFVFKIKTEYSTIIGLPRSLRNILEKNENPKEYLVETVALNVPQVLVHSVTPYVPTRTMIHKI